jgi:hypothetical protein
MLGVDRVGFRHRSSIVEGRLSPPAYSVYMAYGSVPGRSLTGMLAVHPIWYHFPRGGRKVGPMFLGTDGYPWIKASLRPSEVPEAAWYVAIGT